MLASDAGLDATVRAEILAYYRVAAPLIEANFAATPFIYTVYPHGFGADPQWHGALFHTPPFHPPPRGSHTIPVRGKRGSHRYLLLSAQTLLELVEQEGAVEFYGWGCEPNDPAHARFARILLEPDAAGSANDFERMKQAAATMRDVLAAHGLDAVPLLSGGAGIALWMPLSGMPDYAEVRAHLHVLCDDAVKRYPQRFSTQPNSHASGRVHLHVAANAIGRGSALPYSLRGDPRLAVCAPVTWDELSTIAEDAIDARRFSTRLKQRGDVFASSVREARAGGVPVIEAQTKPIEPHGYILRAAIEILQDGAARDAKTIVSEALARELVPAGTRAKYVYTSLLEYIVRTSGHGHRPAIVQNADRTFRINEPADAWPAANVPVPPAPSKDVEGLIARLETCAAGATPADFEIAVCDAFAYLGFSAEHVGGQAAPDGYADAQLGVLGYRTMLECKTGAQVVNEPDAVEASKYRDAYEAQYCALIGPQFSEEVELAKELQTHGVSAWRVDDLSQLLRIGSNPWEMRALFAPGFVSDFIDDVMWARLHGAGKRVALICEYLQQTGWAAQVAAAKQGPPANAPRLTVDAAMLLVDRHLADLGSAASCTREEVALAFEYLTNPRAGVAVWENEAARDALVIVQPPR